MAVDRCICHGVSFADLLRLHCEDGLDLAALKARTGCCTGCTTCEPYVRLTLATGRTDHPVLSPAEAERAMGLGGDAV